MERRRIVVAFGACLGLLNIIVPFSGATQSNTQNPPLIALETAEQPGVIINHPKYQYHSDPRPLHLAGTSMFQKVATSSNEPVVISPLSPNHRHMAVNQKKHFTAGKSYSTSAKIPTMRQDFNGLLDPRPMTIPLGDVGIGQGQGPGYSLGQDRQEYTMMPSDPVEPNMMYMEGQQQEPMMMPVMMPAPDQMPADAMMMMTAAGNEPTYDSPAAGMMMVMDPGMEMSMGMGMDAAAADPQWDQQWSTAVGSDGSINIPVDPNSAVQLALPCDGVLASICANNSNCCKPPLAGPPALTGSGCVTKYIGSGECEFARSSCHGCGFCSGAAYSANVDDGKPVQQTACPLGMPPKGIYEKQFAMEGSPVLVRIQASKARS